MNSAPRLIAACAAAPLFAAPAVGQLVNGGAETGDLTGWTGVNQGPTDPAIGVLAAGDASGVAPVTGSFAFAFDRLPSGIGTTLRLQQRRVITNPSGTVSVFAQVATDPNGGFDTARVRVIFLDAAEVPFDDAQSPAIVAPSFSELEFFVEPPPGAAFAVISLEGNTGGDQFARAYFDDVSLRVCPADIAPPFGVYDLSDVQTFLIGFGTIDPVADLVRDGSFDLSDVQTFLIAFGAGCF